MKKSDAKRLVFESDGILKRIRKHSDLFAPVLQLKQKLPALAKLRF
jgi:bifunctional non-homologous end joining protein LigD